MKKYLLFVFISSVLIGCGYKPMSRYIKNDIGENIFVKPRLTVNNNIYSTDVKDEISYILKNKFRVNLADSYEEASSIMYASFINISFSSLQSEDGYIKFYKTNIGIKLDYFKKNSGPKSIRTIKLYGSSDYAVEADPILTNLNKYESVQNALKNALRTLLSTLSVESLKQERKKVNGIDRNKSESFFFFK